MALTLVGTASGIGTGASYSVDLSLVSIQQGDIVVVSTGFGSTTSSAPTCSGNNSGAYTGAGAHAYADDAQDTNYRMFYKVQGATPDTSLTIGRQNNAAYGGGAAVQVWRGVDTSTPLDVTGTPATTTNSPRGNPPSVTPTTSGAVVIAGGAGTQGTGGSAITVPSGMSDGVTAFCDGTTSDVCAWIASAAWTSGAYDPPAWTDGAGSSSNSAAAQTIAIRPSKSIAADAGSFTLTGAAASLECGRRLASDAGAFTFTGAAASLVYGRPIAADAGSFALTGGDAGLRVTRTLAFDSGSFALTGGDVALVYGRFVAANAGSFTAAGGDVTLGYSGDDVVTAWTVFEVPHPITGWIDYERPRPVTEWTAMAIAPPVSGWVDYRITDD